MVVKISKITRYVYPREKLVKLEMERFYGEDNKEKRMKNREAMIKQETSELKKHYLQAQQFFDTFSYRVECRILSVFS